ncbi:MAG: hypothetical protein U0172_10285 [Nitrospiraceae bacterium]
MLEELTTLAQSRVEPPTTVWLLEEIASLYAKTGDKDGVETAVTRLSSELANMRSQKRKYASYQMQYEIHALLHIARNWRTAESDSVVTHYVRRAEALAASDPHPQTKPWSLMEVAQYDLQQHDAERARKKLQQALDAAELVSADPLSVAHEKGTLREVFAVWALDAQMYEVARTTIKDAITALDDVGVPGVSSTFLPGIAVLQARSGDRSGVQTSLEELAKVRRLLVQARAEHERDEAEYTYRMKRVVDLGNVADAYAHAGYYEDGVRYLNLAVEALGNADARRDDWAGAVWNAIGKPASALGVMDVALKAEGKVRDSAFREEIYPVLFEALLKKNNLKKALDVAGATGNLLVIS